MTVDEIKSQYSMRDILQMYGLQANRSGFISCPFHSGDHSPSMKIYHKDYHCHACGANGDIFSFIQGMERCSFKEAFLKLGGSYEQKSNWQKKRFEYQLQQKKDKERRELESKKAMKWQIIKDIDLLGLFQKLLPVFSDDWCDVVNEREKLLYQLEELNREGVRIYD